MQVQLSMGYVSILYRWVGYVSHTCIAMQHMYRCNGTHISMHVTTRCMRAHAMHGVCVQIQCMCATKTVQHNAKAYVLTHVLTYVMCILSNMHMLTTTEARGH